MKSHSPNPYVRIFRVMFGDHWVRSPLFDLPHGLYSGRPGHAGATAPAPRSGIDRQPTL